MKYGKLFFVFLLLLNNFNVFSQSSLAQGFPKLMYVTSKTGLSERSEPSTRGNVTERFRYGAMVQVFSRQNTTVTIDGITDYWYSTRYSDKSDRWVFGGYLSEELPDDLPVIVGRWDIINESRMAIVFSIEDNHFHIGIKESSASIGGNWQINGNRITVDLVLYPPPMEEGEVEYETMYIQLNVIDKNNIELAFSREMFGYKSVKLKRSRTGW